MESTDLKDFLENQNFSDNNDSNYYQEENNQSKLSDNEENDLKELNDNDNNNNNDSESDVDFTMNPIFNKYKKNEKTENQEEEKEEDNKQNEMEGYKELPSPKFSKLPVFTEQQEQIKQTQESIENYPQNQQPKQQNLILEEKGYVNLKKVFQSELIDRLCFEVNQFLQMEGVYSHLQKRQDVAQLRYYVNNTYGSLTNFQQIQHYYVPVIDNRGTYNRITDVGVVDIYNADKVFPQIRNYFDLNLMNIILQKLTNIEWKLTRINLQIYSNVQNPMSFHFDGGNEKNIKFTIFLSDIPDEYSGPPVFMEGTHKNKKNIKPSQAKIITGEKGDVLISYQNGFHRKLTQKVQCTNMYLTFHFTTKYEKDRYFPLNF